MNHSAAAAPTTGRLAPVGPLGVALLTPCYWPEVRRGTERFVHELAGALLRRGHQPALITSHPGRPTSRVEDGVPVLRLPRPPEGFLLRRGFESYLTHVPLSRVALEREDPDVAHAVYPTDALAAGSWARCHDRVSVLSYMGIPHPDWLAAQRLRQRVLRRAMARCDVVVALSEHAARAFARLGQAVEVIPPPVDLEVFAPRPQERSAEPTIICPADVTVARKHVPLLIRAVELARRQRPGIRLILSRPTDPAVAARLAAAHVEFRDLDDRATLATEYRRAWVSALPAEGEAFGLVLVEALACGTPVVGLADGGIPEIIDRDAVGRLVGELQAASLATGLLETIELAEEPGTAAACRARAAEFSTDRCAERYLELYRRLGAGGPPPTGSTCAR